MHSYEELRPSYDSHGLGFRPDEAGFQGDEERIEEISGQFYERLEPHFCFKTGVLSEAAHEEIDLLKAQLLIGEDGKMVTDPIFLQDVESAEKDALRSLETRKEQLDWMV